MDVIAPAASEGDDSLLSMIPTYVNIHRTGPSLYDRIQGRIARLPKGRIRNILRGACAVAGGLLIAPDVRRGWERQVLRMAKMAKLSEVDLIVSSAGTNTAHLAASRLARLWRKPWIAEYGDPWSLNPLRPASYWHIRKWNTKLERSALRHCHGITVTTATTASAMRNWLSDSCPRVEVVPCGFSSTKSTVNENGSKDKIIVSYIGTAGRGSRDLRLVMRALNRAARECKGQVVFRMVGAISPAFQEIATDLPHLQVESVGWVSYRQSLERMRESDLLLLIGNSQPLQLPAKVFNYIASERPILYVPQLRPEMDEARHLISQLSGVIILGDGGGGESLESQLRNALQRRKELLRDSARRMDATWLQEFDWERVGQRFGAFATRICSAAAKAS